VRRVISVRLSEADDARIRGAAAIAGLSIAEYLRWLVSNGKTGTQNDTEMVLRRLDDLAAAIANIGTRRDDPVTLVGLPARSAIVARLKARGVPSSTIRQVEATLDELEGKASRGAAVNTNVNAGIHARQ
jgi:mobilization protein NikA